MGGAERAPDGGRALGPLAGLTTQLPDSIDCDRVETGESVCLDIKAPVLNPLQQLRTLQTQLFGQLVNSRRQRQLLPDQIPVSRVSRDPGTRWIQRMFGLIPDCVLVDGGPLTFRSPRYL